MAKPIQADDGSGRGPARGLLRWAKVSVGSGDRRRRASSARDPPTLPRRVFDRLGPDKGPSTVQKRFNMMARAVEGAPDCAPPRHISRMRVRALHRCLATCASYAAAEVLRLCRRERSSREREQQSEAGRRRRGQVIAGKSSSEAVRAHADDGGDMGCEGCGRVVVRQRSTCKIFRVFLFGNTATPVTEHRFPNSPTIGETKSPFSSRIRRSSRTIS